MSEWRLRWNHLRWREALEQGVENADLLERIRAATRTGRPVGSEDFVRGLEAGTRRILRPQKRGPKVETEARGYQLELGVS